MAPRRALIMKSPDNVATVVEDVQPGEEVSGRVGDDTRTVTARERIPFGFKVALVNIPQGAIIVKYGEAIGRASAPIQVGDLVHVHNVEGARGRGDLVKGGR